MPRGIQISKHLSCNTLVSKNKNMKGLVLRVMHVMFSQNWPTTSREDFENVKS